MGQIERRIRGRMALRLPLVVTGVSADGAAWCEPTESEDVSTAGASFRLSNEVGVGDRLRLRAQPCGARETVETEVVVVHTAPAPFGGTRAGVLVSGPTEAWLRFYLSWAGETEGAPEGAAVTES